MSYILDALRKSEKERQIGQIPQIGVTPSSQHTQSRSLFFWILIILIAFNTALFAYLLSTNRSSTISKSNIQKASNKPKVPVSETIKERSLRDPQTLPKLTQNNSEIGPKRIQKNGSKSKLQAIDSDITKNLPKQQAKNKIEPNPTPDTTPILTHQNLTEDKTIVHPIEPAISPTQSNAQLKSQKPNSNSPIPMLQSMPTAFQQDIPPMNINIYVYADDPKERFVIIDMQKYRVGERIANGPVLEKIEEDMMLMKYKGRNFRVLRP